MFVSLSYRAARLLPENVGTLAKMLVVSAIPVFICIPMRTAIHLPEKVGALSNDLIQASLCLAQNIPIIPKRFQLPTPTACILVVRFSRSASGTSCAWAAALSAFSSYS